MSGYNAAFVAALRRDLHSQTGTVKRRAAELARNREVERLFPGHDAVWLQKENCPNGEKNCLRKALTVHSRACSFIVR